MIDAAEIVSRLDEFTRAIVNREEPLPLVVLNRLGAVTEDIRNIIAAAPLHRDAEVFVAGLPDATHRVSWGYGRTAEITVAAESKNAPETLRTIVRRIRMAGYKRAGNYGTDSAVYLIFRPADDRNYSDSITVSFNPSTKAGESASCKLVQVGTRMQEVPVYKMECTPPIEIEDMPAPEPAAEVAAPPVDPDEEAVL